MARLGRASTPIDLMTYAPSDQQPSVFLLKEDRRQAIPTVFNWTERARTRAINLTQKPHSVRVTELIVTVTVTGLGAVTNRKTVAVSVAGSIATGFEPLKKERAE